MKLYIKDAIFIDTAEPLDISIPLVSGKDNLTAWHVDPPRFEPVVSSGFMGSVADGGSVNFRNIYFNPHGHGTHTECLGHITNNVFSVNKTVKQFFWRAHLISIEPKVVFNKIDGKQDRVICRDQLSSALEGLGSLDALIIRSIPNSTLKRSSSYSDTNPPYFEPEIVELLNNLGVKHLLVDLPSVDRETDEGKLAFHHRFWGVPHNPDHTRTITELIFVNDSIADGEYLLDLQLAAFENDASPSRPVLYQIKYEH
jgi:arylformamidase